MSPRLAHFIHLVVVNIAVVGISAAALFYSLGYQYNFATRSIQQTGIITLDSDFYRYEVNVWVNNELVAQDLPYRHTWMFPGTYEVKLEKDGYQTWLRTVEVTENTVNSFKHILLIREEPPLRDATADEISDLANARYNRQDIEVRNSNELWLKEKFITRTSDDITNHSWFPDNDHIVYQAGSTLWLMELDGLSNQRLLATSSQEPVFYTFRNGGRTMIFEDQGVVQVAELY